MNNTFSLFEGRRSEIEFYYSILLDIENNTGKIQTIDNSKFFRILKSNFLLMLYNLIEACVVSGMLEIYESLKKCKAKTAVFPMVTAVFVTNVLLTRY